MRPFKRVKMLDADEYRVLKRAVSSPNIAVGKARRAKIVLLSNQGHTAREIAAELVARRSRRPLISRSSRRSSVSRLLVTNSGLLSRG